MQQHKNHSCWYFSPSDTPVRFYWFVWRWDYPLRDGGIFLPIPVYRRQWGIFILWLIIASLYRGLWWEQGGNSNQSRQLFVSVVNQPVGEKYFGLIFNLKYKLFDVWNVCVCMLCRTITRGKCLIIWNKRQFSFWDPCRLYRVLTLRNRWSAGDCVVEQPGRPSSSQPW